jgi:hypothetical protein
MAGRRTVEMGNGLLGEFGGLVHRAITEIAAQGRRGQGCSLH